jgi:predicted RNase H-like HicB family nuclease
MSTERAVLTPVFEDDADGWVMARIAELPEVITAGRDREDAHEMLRDALREYLLFLIEDGRPLPRGVTLETPV